MKDLAAARGALTLANTLRMTGGLLSTKPTTDH